MNQNATPLYPDLQIDQWLKDGTRHTPTLPDLARYIAKLRPRPERILDTGCGSGELLRLLLAEGFPANSLWGIDIEPDHAKLARRRTGLETIIEARWSAAIRWPWMLDLITAINWLQSDWPSEYAVKAARCLPNSARLVEFVEGCERYLRPAGLLIWDWHTTPENDFIMLLEKRGWLPHDMLLFDHTDYPERYPIYVYRRPAT